MTIRRYEQIDINNLTFSKSAFGQQETVQTKWFATRAEVQDVANSVRISEKFRLYKDMVNFTIHYTPNAKQIVMNQNLYSVTWRGDQWLIEYARESNDRMSVRLMCYKTDPVTAV